MDGSPVTEDLFPQFDHCVRQFEAFGHLTHSALHECFLQGNRSIQVLYHTNEFWTSLQRQGNGLHEISYRACFKPQLPGFFIERLTRPGEVVFDPFMGRGTTLIEAALMDRIPMGCDVNPLSQYLVRPRLNPLRSVMSDPSFLKKPDPCCVTAMKRCSNACDSVPRKLVY